MSTPITDKPVLITGANGFIAAHIIEQLLAAGYRVRGTVRSVKNPDKSAHLTSMPGANERLDLVEANLLDDGAFDAACAGVDYVMHTASPYALDVKDPQKELVDPAVQGTLNVLRSAKKTGGVKRVVLTSSGAAVTDEGRTGHVFTEADWNEKSTLSRNPYYLSKAEAERSAWRFVDEEDVGFDLVAINPFVVVGPSHTKSVNTSVTSYVSLLHGEFPGLINLEWPTIDVRDVARAHILAMETPEAKGRYLLAERTMPMSEVVALMREHGWDEGHKLPKMSLENVFGDALVKLSSFTQPKAVGTYLRTHIGKEIRADMSKAKRALGLEPRPAPESVLDTLEDLARWGHIEDHRPERAAA